LAPDLIWSEVANIVWKQCRRGGIHPDEAIEIVEQFLALPMEIHPANTLAAQATRLAIDTGRTAYDCMYLALAIREDCPLLTADSRLVNALSHTDFARQVRLLDAGIDGR
jgi:predicted nucleic acid-binding protein